jgi:hypothetical protein
MEIDGGSPTQGRMEVSGKLFHFNKGAAFFSFHHDGSDHVCLFRPNKILIEKQKLGASNFKSVESIGKVNSPG